MRVVRRDQIELSARLPDAEVRLDPFQPFGSGTFPWRSLASAGEGLGGDVGCGDLPARGGQPDGFRSLATAGIQRRARRQTADLAHEIRVWIDLLAGSVSVRLLPVGVPVVLVEFLCHHTSDVSRPVRPLPVIAANEAMAARGDVSPLASGRAPFVPDRAPGGDPGRARR